MKKLNSEQEILKLIDTQIKFADTVFKDFRGKRYGMDTCSPESMNKALIDQYICSWENNKAAYSGNPETTYTSTTWRRRMDYPLTWVTYGDFEGNNPCTGVCDMDHSCIDYNTAANNTGYLTVAVHISSSVINTQYLPNASGQAVLFAQVPDNQAMMGWRCAGSVELNNTDSNGDLWLPVYGDDPFTDAVDGVLASESVRFILRDGCRIYKIIFDNSEWAHDPQGYNPFPPQTDDEFWNCGEESYIENNVIIDACKTYEINKYPKAIVLCDACFGGKDADCVYCGTELVQTFMGSGPTPLPTQEVQCIDDQECIHITVKNQCGDPIKDYEIYIDNKFIGKTDELGKISTTILQASTNWNHLLNFCYCFTTTGLCNQQKIDMIVHQDGVECEDCKPVQKCENAVKPLSEPILIEDVIKDPNDPTGPTTAMILCFTCDEENPAFSVGSYIQVPPSITDCTQVEPLGYWVNAPGDCIPPPVCGCTDPEATNYNPLAVVPCDGLNCFKCQEVGVPNCCCTYPPRPPRIHGCLDPEALNYNSQANADCDGVLIENLPPGDYGNTECCVYPIAESKCFWMETHKPLGPRAFKPNSLTSADDEYVYFYPFKQPTQEWFWFWTPVRLPSQDMGEIVNQENYDCQSSTDLTNKNAIFDIRIEFEFNEVFPGVNADFNDSEGNPIINQYPGNVYTWLNNDLFHWANSQNGLVWVGTETSQLLQQVFSDGPDPMGGVYSNTLGIPGPWDENNTLIQLYTCEPSQQGGGSEETLAVLRIRYVTTGDVGSSGSQPVVWIPWRVKSGSSLEDGLLTGSSTPVTFKFGSTCDNLDVPDSFLWNSTNGVNIAMIWNQPGITDFADSYDLCPMLDCGVGYNSTTGDSIQGVAQVWVTPQ